MSENRVVSLIRSLKQAFDFAGGVVHIVTLKDLKTLRYTSLSSIQERNRRRNIREEPFTPL